MRAERSQCAPLCLSLPGQDSAVLTAMLGHILLQQKTSYPVSLIKHLNPGLEDFLLRVSYSSDTPPFSWRSQEGVEA